MCRATREENRRKALRALDFLDSTRQLAYLELRVLRVRLTRTMPASSLQDRGWKTKERRMLVLSRKKNESIVINDDITIVVVEIRGDKVRLGVEAPKEVPVHRREVFDAIRRNESAAGGKAKEKESGTNNTAETDAARTPSES